MLIGRMRLNQSILANLWEECGASSEQQITQRECPPLWIMLEVPNSRSFTPKRPQSRRWSGFRITFKNIELDYCRNESSLLFLQHIKIKAHACSKWLGKNTSVYMIRVESHRTLEISVQKHFRWAEFVCGAIFFFHTQNSSRLQRLNFTFHDVASGSLKLWIERAQAVFQLNNATIYPCRKWWKDACDCDRRPCRARK